MGTTIKDHFDRICDYNGDLKKDTGHYNVNGLKKFKKQLDRISKDVGVLIADKESKQPQKEYYTVEEASKYWGVSKQTIYNKIKSGEIKPLRNGRNVRIPKEGLKNYFKFSLNNDYNKSLIICKRTHDIFDDKNILVTSSKVNSYYSLVYLGRFVVKLFDIKNKEMILISYEHYNKEFKLADEFEISVFIHNM